jgi:hypothetical protein
MYGFILLNTNYLSSRLECDSWFFPACHMSYNNNLFHLSRINAMEQKQTQRERLEQAPSRSDLPRKDQLLLLFLCRLFDFIQVAIFQTICYYQLKSFDSVIPETTLSWQTGIAIGAFTAAQICTSVLWGICADKEWCGRKPVLLIGLFGTAISCVGSAFSQSFYQMVLFRVIGGLFNGTVGVVLVPFANRRFRALSD